MTTQKEEMQRAYQTRRSRPCALNREKSGKFTRLSFKKEIRSVSLTDKAWQAAQMGLEEKGGGVSE